MGEAFHDWDGWLNGLVADEVADVRAYLIAKISRGMSEREGLRAGDADRLAEIAVDCMIEYSRTIRPS
jgi:hypothetical protein